MPDSKISSLTELAEVPASTDEFVIVDKSDTTMALTGTTKKIKASNIVPTEIARASSANPTSFAFSEDTDNGTNKITVTAPSAIASDKVLTLPDATDTLVGKDTTDTLTNKTLSTGSKIDANADGNITYYGMARQAIMNGNFDVWQRGFSFTPLDLTIVYSADRWGDYINKDGGTLPTLTRLLVATAGGEIDNTQRACRLTTNGAGTSLGVNSTGQFFQRIEKATSRLCGLNKKITVSFWAKSDIANKRICLTLQQTYGTGGSPSSPEYIKGNPITLTNVWKKYTVTFTTNTLVGKTFGTNDDDYIALVFNYIWGTTFGDTYVQTGVSAETFVGAGNIDIAQVQLCAGDVALPFQPKSYGEEFRLCRRYYRAYVRPIAQGNGSATTFRIFTQVMDMRITPICSTNGAASFFNANSDGRAVTAPQTFTSLGVDLYTGNKASGTDVGYGPAFYEGGVTLDAEL